MATIDSTLTEIMKLDYNSREMLLEILQKRQIETRRAEMATNAKKSLKDFHAGDFVPPSAEEAIRELNA